MGHWILLSISIGLTAVGQLLFKKGMMALSPPSTSLAWWGWIVRGLVNPWVLLGFLSFGVGALLWLAVLAKEEISYAYPLSSLGYLVVALGSYGWFHEQLSWSRWVGLLLLILAALFIEHSR